MTGSETVRTTSDSAETHIRVVIADDHAMFRAGLRELLEAEPGFEVVGEAENGVSATAMVRKHEPDVLLLDYAMPGMNGAEVLREVATRRSSTRVVILTASITPRLDGGPATGGCRRFDENGSDRTALRVRQWRRGHYWVGRDNVGSVVEALACRTARRASHASIRRTPRVEVVRLVVESCSNREIAGRLRISETRETSPRRDLQQLDGTSSRVELALFANHHRLGS